MNHALKDRTAHGDPPAAKERVTSADGGGGSTLVIHCRRFNQPPGPCAYCERIADYKIANGADPEFEEVCIKHASEWLTAVGSHMAALVPLPPQ